MIIFEMGSYFSVNLVNFEFWRRLHPSISVLSCKYSTSSKYSKERPEVHSILSVDGHTSSSWTTYIIV